MYTAISGGSLDIVKMLIARDIPVKHLRDNKGWRPIHQAALNGHSAMIEFLMKNGADLNARTPSGKSAYNIAGEAGRKDVLELIGKLGGDPSPQQFPELRGPYLGQPVPGQNPSVFAPDIVVANHSGLTISPDGNEFYWQSPEQTIWTTKLENGLWTKPEAVPFSQKIKGLFVDDVPFITPDGRKMFFTSRRPVDSASDRKRKHLVCREKFVRLVGPETAGPRSQYDDAPLAGLRFQFRDPLFFRRRAGWIRRNGPLLFPAHRREVHQTAKSGPGRQRQDQRWLPVRRAGRILFDLRTGQRVGILDQFPGEGRKLAGAGEASAGLPGFLPHDFSGRQVSLLRRQRDLVGGGEIHRRLAAGRTPARTFPTSCSDYAATASLRSSRSDR